MMKHYFILIVFSLMLAGCADKIQSYIDEPKTFLKDPHFDNYKDGLEALESSYLKKEISYAEYLDKKEKLDNQYSKEVQAREAIIQSQK